MNRCCSAVSHLCSLLAAAMLAACASNPPDKFASCYPNGDGFSCASGIACERASPSSYLCTGGLRCYARDESLHCTDGTVYGKRAAEARAAAAQDDIIRRSQYHAARPSTSSPASCTLLSGGLLRCSNGVSCQATAGSGLVRCNNGLSCQLDQSGLMRCNNGTSSTADAGGLRRFSDGSWSIADESGLTRNSDGSYCITDKQFGLTRCYPRR